MPGPTMQSVPDKYEQSVAAIDDGAISAGTYLDRLKRRLYLSECQPMCSVLAR